MVDDRPGDLRAWLEAVHLRCQARGVTAPDQAAMGADLAADLAAAFADGADVGDVVSIDPAAFADAVAEASGTVPTLPSGGAEPDKVPARAVLAGVAGALVAGAVCWYAGYPAMGWWVDLFIGRGALEVVAIFSVHILFGLLTLASALVGVAMIWRPASKVLPTFGRLALWVAVFGVASIPPTVGLAWSTGFSTDSGVVLAEVVVIGAFVASGIHLGLRRVRHVPHRPAALEG
jgi:hypothetical protein